jgi:hypothetical protein
MNRQTDSALAGLFGDYGTGKIVRSDSDPDDDPSGTCQPAQSGPIRALSNDELTSNCCENCSRAKFF